MTSTSQPPPPPSETGKLFVGGISSATTEAELRAHFEMYGEVAEAVTIRERTTGNGRGFGFVKFVDPAAADRAIEQTDHVVLGRTVEVKRALPRGERQSHNILPYPNNFQHNDGISNSNSSNGNGPLCGSKKIFVGGLPSNLTEAGFRNYFEKFGQIVDVVVMYDSTTQRARGFGFITYDSEESVENVMQNTHHELNGKTVEVKRAVPKDGSHGSHHGSGNLRANGGKGTASRNYQSGFYPPSGPRYGFYHGYAPSMYPGYTYGPSGYFSGYPYVSYVGAGYAGTYGGVRSPWNGPRLVSPGCSTVPPYYGVAISGYMGNGFGNYMGIGAGGYQGDITSDNVNSNDNGSEVRISEVKEGDNVASPPVEVGSPNAR